MSPFFRTNLKETEVF